MTDKEITREHNPINRMEVFKKRTDDFFATYENSSGSEDGLEICLIRDGCRAVSQAEEIINRLQAENEKLKTANASLSKEIINTKIEMYKLCIEEMREKIVNTPFDVDLTGKTNEYREGYLDGLVAKQHNILDMLDNLLKELIGE